MAACSCGQPHVPAFGRRPCMGHANVKDDDGRIVGRRPCRRAAAVGQDKCKTHGGGSPQAKRAAAERVVEQKAARVLRRFGEPVDTTPTEALLDAVKWTAGYVAWLRDKVAGVHESTVRTEDEAQAAETRALVQYAKDSGKVEPSVWVDLLGQWHDRLVRICGEAIKAGIEERRVRIAEQQGALVADVIRKILAQLDLTPEQATRAGNVVPLELRRLAG